MQTTRDLNAKLPLKVKFGYGTSGFCSFITWTVFSYYGLYFMNEVVGLSAAGGAAFVLGTLEYAKEKGCATAGITCNPDTPITYPRLRSP